MNIITVTLSPAIDIHCRAESFSAEKENFAEITSKDAGGKGVNISRALSSCGIKSTAVVAVGKDNADGFLSSLSVDGVDFEAIYTMGSIRENITVHPASSKETRLSFSGFSGDCLLIEDVENCVRNMAQKGDLVAIAGSIPSGIGVEAVKNFVLRLKADGVRVIIDSRSFSKDDTIECAPFLIKPNEEEIVAYTGHVTKDLEEASAAAESIRQKGIENVMISLGAKGAVLATECGIFFAEAPKITALSTIGAGDSSIAGFLAAYRDGKSYGDCLKNAIAYGSAACLTDGTRPPKKDDIERFIAKTDVTFRNIV